MKSKKNLLFIGMFVFLAMSNLHAVNGGSSFPVKLYLQTPLNDN